jgi:hypothetical protein
MYSITDLYSVKTTEESSEIDFKDANALRALTTALLKEDWNLDVQLREDRLCPTVSPDVQTSPPIDGADTSSSRLPIGMGRDGSLSECQLIKAQIGLRSTRA